MKNPYLRVKLKTLAAEAKIIRADELRYKKHGQGENPYRNGLYRHRIDVVRPEARLTLLAYQFIRGVPYSACERPNDDHRLRKHDVTRILAMVRKYSIPHRDVGEEDVTAWINDQKQVPCAA